MLEREGKNEKCCVKHQILGTNQHGVEMQKAAFFANGIPKSLERKKMKMPV